MPNQDIVGVDGVDGWYDWKTSFWPPARRLFLPAFSLQAKLLDLDLEKALSFTYLPAILSWTDWFQDSYSQLITQRSKRE
jgi:hypothetical protein